MFGVRRTFATLGVAGLFSLAAALAANAQTPQHAYLRISARDSTNVPIPQAEFTVTRGLHDVIARGTTDDNGLGFATFEVHDSLDLQVTMRKIGFARTDHFFEAGPRDTAVVMLVAARSAANTLGAVKITAKRENQVTSYVINADDIAASNQTLLDGFDVVKKMRPDMLTSHGGCATGVQNVWVNGKRIIYPLPANTIAAQRARVGVPPRARFTYAAVSVLTDIAPEHIEEMTYKDCFDHSMAVVGSRDALFIVLKPGVVYQPGVGSYVDDTPIPARTHP
jgi:hypothetical protein